MQFDIGSESFSGGPPLSVSAPSPAHSQRLVNVKSRLKQAPRYPSLDRELVEYQERQLFEYFVVVSLHKKQAGAAYVPELTQQFPLKVWSGPSSVACHGLQHSWEDLTGAHGSGRCRSPRNIQCPEFQKWVLIKVY